MRHNMNPWMVEQVRHAHHGPHGGRGRGGPWGGPMGGPPPWVAQLFGPQWGSQGRRAGRRPRVRRGDVRIAILDVLDTATGPMNGYQMIQQIHERSNERWKPSPGSVYPTIAQLQDEGLVEDAPTGRKAVQLTAEGREYAEQNADELAAVWSGFADEAEDPEDTEAADFKQVIGQTVGAIVQIATSGSSGQRDQALEILADTRRRLYGLLAEGPDSAEEE